MSKPKYVLIYATQHMLTGGIESHLLSFCENMSYSNVKIDLFVLNSRMDDATAQRYRKSCNQVFLGSKRLWHMLTFVLFYLKVIRRRYHAIYTNGQGDSIYLISKMFRYKNWIHHHHTAGDAADQKTWSLKYIKAMLKAPVVIACSTTNAVEMQKSLKRDVTSIPCFSREINIVASDRKDNRVQLGYYGRLISEKGIDLLCQLSEDGDLVHIQFHIWGEGEQYPADFFDKFPRLRYHGKFNGKEELYKVLETIDGYLLLSTHPEGLPVSLLEVMSAGIPWLATNKGGIADIVCDPLSTRLLSSLDSYNNIKKEISQFAADISEGKINKEKQKSLYKSRFSPDILVNQWKSVLFN